MTVKEMAALMDGMENGEQYKFIEELVDNKMIAIYGEGDDMIEMSGYEYDVCGCFNGGRVSIAERPGLGGEYCFIKSNGKNEIEAVWCGEGKPAWIYKTDIPHETFRIMEDGEVYCEGIVFKAEELVKEL